MRGIHLVGLLALAALPLAAQQPPAGGCPMMQGEHQGHGQMQGGACPMRHGMGGVVQGAAEPALAPVWEAMTFCPSRLLDQKDDLELTAQQEAKLEELLESAQRAVEAAQADAQKESDGLARVLRVSRPDVKEVERRFGLLHAALGNAHLIRLRMSIQARAVLTDEQREKVIAQFAAAGGCGHPSGQ